ncbi:hypothetical protein QTH90_23905 [Variovorax sp. J2P1-59]|uniref:hypothetical protein n=1 Tax=Variovorax flavidus TaxID=3053501 RepID=UPI00257749DA|nr:hypothetical protein [Variovorax sp. J2P1-59]MDM0077472.1 hypothetical protein [Variovorax sp. J2P1-59]
MKAARDAIFFNDKLRVVNELQEKYAQSEPAIVNVEINDDLKKEVQQFKSYAIDQEQLSADAWRWVFLESLAERRKNPIFYSDLPQLLDQETWAPPDGMLILAGVAPRAAVMEWSYRNFMGAEIDTPRIKHANWFTCTSDLYTLPVVDDFKVSADELREWSRKSEKGEITLEENRALDHRLSEEVRWAEDKSSNYKSEVLRLRAEMVGALKRRWDSGEHDPSQRRAPAFFVRWAESRGFEVEWAAWAREQGFLERDAPATEPPYFDADSEDYPELLHIAVRAWDHARKGAGGTPKKRITAFVAARYPHISDGAKDAISLIANWQKSGGRPRMGG